MEWSIKVLVAAILGMIAVLILATILTGWGGQAGGLIDSFMKWVNSFFEGRPYTPLP